MSATVTLEYRGLALTVRSSSATVLRWLTEFLSPAFAPSVKSGWLEVDLVFDADRFRDSMRGARPTGSEADVFTLDQGHMRLPLLETKDGLMAYEEQRRVLIGRAPLALIAETDHDRARTMALRLVREAATAHALGSGDLPLHAAGVACGGTATLFVGPKRAGKTSLLLYALNQPRARYLSNDRIFVAPDSRTARPMPTLVKIRPETLAFHPLLRRTLRSTRLRGARTADEVYQPTPRWPPLLSPLQLCSLVGATATSSAAVRTLVFVERDRTVERFALRPLEPLEAVDRLARDGLLAGGTAASFLFDSARRGDLEMRLRALADKICCVSLALGPRAYEDESLWVAIVEQAAHDLSAELHPDEGNDPPRVLDVPAMGQLSDRELAQA